MQHLLGVPLDTALILLLSSANGCHPQNSPLPLNRDVVQCVVCRLVAMARWERNKELGKKKKDDDCVAMHTNTCKHVTCDNDSKSMLCCVLTRTFGQWGPLGGM